MREDMLQAHEGGLTITEIAAYYSLTIFVAAKMIRQARAARRERQGMSDKQKQIIDAMNQRIKMRKEREAQQNPKYVKTAIDKRGAKVND